VFAIKDVEAGANAEPSQEVGVSKKDADRRVRLAEPIASPQPCFIIVCVFLLYVGFTCFDLGVLI
jgi:hypothetical protein